MPYIWVSKRLQVDNQSGVLSMEMDLNFQSSFPV